MYASTLLTPPLTAPFYHTIYLRPSAGALNQVLQAVVPAGSNQAAYHIMLKVPEGWYYSFTFLGTGTGASGAWDGKVCVYEDK